MTEIRGSLYDVVGYLIPGVIAALGFLIAFVAVTGGTPIVPDGPSLIVVIHAMGAYIMGHFVQGLANLLPFLRGVDPGASVTRDGSTGTAVLSKATMDLLEARMGDVFGKDVLSLSGNERFALIDEARNEFQRDGDREVYIYHHGFYRGLIVSLGVLAAAALAAAVRQGGCVRVGTTAFCWTRSGSLALALLAVLIAFVSWRRFLRFGEYRVVRAVFLWLSHASKRITPPLS